RIIERTEGWAAAADFHDRVLFQRHATLPRPAYIHASLCNRHAKRPTRAEEIIKQGLAQHPAAKNLLREAAELSMAQADWPAAITRWTAYTQRLLRAHGPSAA